MSQIICTDLSIGYEQKEVQSTINFRVEEGDYLCIIGENGAGKSTLMKTMLGLLSPIAGTIEFGDGLKKNEMGYLPQQTVAQKDFPASAYEIVISGCQARCGMRPFYSKEEKQLALEMMDKLGISDLKNKCYRELSGGQQQRVLLARALCATRKALLLDEPVSGLDPKATEEMYKLIKDLNDEGITIIMITHDLEAVFKYSKNVMHLCKETFFGTNHEFMHHYENVHGGGHMCDCDC